MHSLPNGPRGEKQAVAWSSAVTTRPALQIASRIVDARMEAIDDESGAEIGRGYRVARPLDRAVLNRGVPNRGAGQRTDGAAVPVPICSTIAAMSRLTSRKAAFHPSTMAS